MKALLLSVLICLAVYARADFESHEEYSPEKENFALGFNPMEQSIDDQTAFDEGKTRKLGPMQQCLWDLLVCWNKREKNSSRCGWDYSDCIEKAKKGKPEPPPPVPPKETLF